MKQFIDILEVLTEAIEIGLNECEGVIDLVGNASGKLTDGCQLLRLKKLSL